MLKDNILSGSVNKRKVFIDNNYVVSACGCFFVNTISKKILLIRYSDFEKPLDDLGGKVDHIDINKIETIYREVDEESNGYINKQIISDLMHTNKYFACYTEKSKYFFLTFEVDDSFFPDTSVFGTCEFHENLNRTIDWYDIKEVLRDKKLACRILCPGMLDYLKQI